MPPTPLIEEPEWNEHMMQPIEHVPTRNRSPKTDDGRSEAFSRPHLSIDSGGSQSSGGDRKDSLSTQGRRSRPSVTASQSQLPSVREKKERDKETAKRRESEKGEPRHLSNETTVAWDTVRERPSVASQLSSQEKVISSRDVRLPWNGRD